MSPSRTALLIARATRRRTASPRAWPYWLLTSENRSRSRTIRLSGAPFADRGGMGGLDGLVEIAPVEEPGQRIAHGGFGDAGMEVGVPQRDRDLGRQQVGDAELEVGVGPLGADPGDDQDRRQRRRRRRSARPSRHAACRRRDASRGTRGGHASTSWIATTRARSAMHRPTSPCPGSISIPIAAAGKPTAGLQSGMRRRRRARRARRRRRSAARRRRPRSRPRSVADRGPRRARG